MDNKKSKDIKNNKKNISNQIKVNNFNVEEIERNKKVKSDKIVFLSSLLVVVAIVLIIYMIFAIGNYMRLLGKDKIQKFDNLDFYITVKDDGDVIIREIWDIDIKNTKTLYKNFVLDPKFYNAITNISVKDITNGGNTNEFSQINEYNYHLSTGTFYALHTERNLFEIAWGTPSTDKVSNRKYEISYTLDRAMINYRDCSELYWQLLGDEFTIPAKRITGKITLPEGISNKDDIKVWGHIKSLNGNVKVIDEKTIEFNVNNYKGYEYLEIRFLIPRGIINTTNGNNRNTDIMESVINEEERWIDDANKTRIESYIKMTFATVIVLGVVCAEFNLVKKYISSIKKNKKEKIKPEIDFQYFREIPNKELSPGEATFLMYSLNEPTHGDFACIFLSTVLYLANKGYFEIYKGEYDRTHLKLTKKAIDYRLSYRYGSKRDSMPEDVRKIFEYILKIFGEEDTLHIQRITTYINEDKNSGAEFLELMNEVHTKIEVSHSINGNINQNSRKELKKIETEKAFNYAVIMMLSTVLYYLIQYGLVLIGLLMLVFMIIPAVNLAILKISKDNVSYLSQKGLDESDKWDALKQYLKDYSLLKEKDEFMLPLWEEYLIFATAWGISKDVLEKMEPEYKEKMQESKYHDFYYSHEYNKFSVDFKDFANDFITTATMVTTTKTSAGGFGGGFTAGGGFGGGRSRRRWKIKTTLYKYKL